MRTLLFTGKGGVGKTTIAAATAAAAARAGHKTLVLSTDPAHSLADALGLPEPAVGQGIVEVADSLWLLHVDVQARFSVAWSEIQQYLLQVMDSAGVDPIEAEELTVLPGAEEVLALLEVRDRVRSGAWDVVVVDCAPTAETLRLLSLPDALNWYMDRIWPTERRVLTVLRPVLRKAASVPMPANNVFDALERLHAELADVRAVLTDSQATIRLVTTPEAVVFAEARRTLTSLSLYGYRVDGVISNRVFPSEGADAWRQGWVAAQTEQLKRIESDCAPIPVWQARYQDREPVGAAALVEFADQIYADSDPIVVNDVPEPMSVQRVGEDFELTLNLPLAAKGQVDLVRRADELIVTVGAHRRVLSLPSALKRCKVVNAAMQPGQLHVRFAPDPDLFPRKDPA